MPSLLDTLRDQITLDVDSMDPEVAAKYEHTFTDMTSNQAIVYSEAIRPERANALKAACEQAKATGLDIDHQLSDALDLLTVLLAKDVFPHISGRVHAQTSPAHAYNTEHTIAHAKRLVTLFEAHGIPKSRVSIKIPATPESIVACHYLEKIGIRTLATCLFGLPQALAASQAGCLYVAPYFNELAVHFEPGVWKAYSDTANEHPMSSVIRSIVQAFKAIQSSTLVMPASIVTAKEVIALVSLRPDHITLSGAVLEQLASESVESDQKTEIIDTGNADDIDVPETDFLENNAEGLRIALAADAEATRKLADALRIFGDMERSTRDLILQQLNRT